MHKIGQVGFGKIGQALVSQMLESGHHVVAVDIDPGIQSSLESNQFETSEPGVSSIIVESFEAKKLTVHTDFAALFECSALIVCIPLLVQDALKGAGTIDFQPFDRCFESLAEVVHDRMLISLETTVPVGTCRNRIAPIFERHGKIHGRDYLLAFSPERIMSNTMRAQLLSNPKIVAGLTEEALNAVLNVYRSFLPADLVKPVSSIEAAELIKLTAMVSRDVNLGLVNQLSLYCDAANIDIREVLSLVNTDGVTNMLLPGIGVGGHCTPVYPYFLIENFTEHDMTFNLALEARKLNDSMAEHIIDSVFDEFAIKSVLLLGLGFRPQVKEDVFSPAYLVKRALDERGASVFLWDPLYTEEEITTKGFGPVADPYRQSYDAIILITAHEQFKDLDYDRFYKQGTRVFVDGRNCMEQARITSSGIAYRGVGTGVLKAGKKTEIPAREVAGVSDND